jgi:hypothetical protein
MATKERLHQLIDSLPDTPETARRLAAAEHDLEPNGGPTESRVVDSERHAALKKLAGYFERPDTAPWDWDLLRDVKRHAWRV